VVMCDCLTAVSVVPEREASMKTPETWGSAGREWGIASISGARCEDWRRPKGRDSAMRI